MNNRKMNKTVIVILAFLVTVVSFSACSSDETYAHQRDTERHNINTFLITNNIQVISEDQFKKDTVTLCDATHNQWVLFSTTGVYMQILDRGEGSPIKKGQTIDVLCRFAEYNLNEQPKFKITDPLALDSAQLTNEFPISRNGGEPEKLSVTDNSGTFTASFDTKTSLMYSAYNSAAVPSGWLTPLSYINLGRDEHIAHVRLLVPSAQGQSNASGSVYACFYDITYMRGR
jgi:hypothetical protein